MRHTDVAIIGGGLAGSLAAAMLGRAGIDAVLVDPHETYPTDFRCEKLDETQLALLDRTGLADDLMPALTAGQEVWVARFGRLLRRRRHAQASFSYESFVAAVRAQIPASVARVHVKAAAIATGDDRQTVTLSDGSEISARLVVLATGLNNGVRHNTGIGRKVVSEAHSVSIGFDLVPRYEEFSFTSLTYSPERRTDQTSYLTLFRIGGRVRANLFVYREINDPWLREMRRGPEATLKALMPRLEGLIGDFAVEGDVRVRPVDLYVTESFRRPGIVLVGDAFATSCPAAGTGVNKVLTDVVQLAREHVAGWLSTPGMGAEKISAFYDDPVKRATDEHSQAKAYFLRSLSTAPGLNWQVQRLARGAAQIALGTVEAAERALRPATAWRPGDEAVENSTEPAAGSARRTA